MVSRHEAELLSGTPVAVPFLDQCSTGGSSQSLHRRLEEGNNKCCGAF